MLLARFRSDAQFKNTKNIFPWSQEHYTVPKTRQISENIREEVTWSENFRENRGNGNEFPRITGKYSLKETSSSLLTEICQIFGTVYRAAPFAKIDLVSLWYYSIVMHDFGLIVPQTMRRMNYRVIF